MNENELTSQKSEGHRTLGVRPAAVLSGPSAAFFPVFASFRSGRQTCCM